MNKQEYFDIDIEVPNVILANKDSASQDTSTWS